MENNSDKKRRPPPIVASADPRAELEAKLLEDPDNLDTKTDVGSDESMDASDTPSITEPGHNEPVPSSGSPDEDEDEDAAE